MRPPAVWRRPIRLYLVFGMVFGALIVWLCNYLDISSYIWVKIFASREEMLFFGWSGPDHGRAAAETVHWLPRPRSHSAIGTRYTAPLLIQHFPKIFSYTYSVDVMCHVNNLVNMRPLSGAVPPRPRLLPAAAIFSWKITLFLLYIIINIFQWPPNHLKLSEIDLD